MAAPNRLYFGDCLDVMREDIPDESVDLIYLDPPFNSKRLYNAFIGGAQWVAFDDTWRWHEAIADFHEVASRTEMAGVMEGLRLMLGEGPTMAYLSYMANRLAECRRILSSTGSIYLHCDPTMSHYLKALMDGIWGQRNFRNEIIWCYAGGGIPKQDFPRKHDVILRFTKTQRYHYQPIYRPYSPGTLQRGRTQVKGKYFAQGLRREGTPVNDWWADMPKITSPTDPEKLGYPTQKPLVLLERIIAASSNEGDVVLDPFCGCGTTIHAAQNLNRRWIGIDICVNACQIIEQRLRSHFDSIWDGIQFIGIPKTVDDAKTLASLDKFRFERWAASLVDGMEANKKQRGDKGIDGYGRIPIRKGQFIDMVSQVKGGGTSPGDVQAFNGARQQAGADLGIFTCFEERVTHNMKDAAVSCGRFMESPVVQIYTVEDYFTGKQPRLPIAV